MNPGGPSGCLPGFCLPQIAGWATLSSLSATSSGPCGVYQRQSSAAMCWGRQVGSSPAQLANYSVPTAVAGGGSWNWLASGAYINSSTGDKDAFACGIRADGSLACCELLCPCGMHARAAGRRCKPADREQMCFGLPATGACSLVRAATACAAVTPGGCTPNNPLCFPRLGWCRGYRYLWPGPAGCW